MTSITPDQPSLLQLGDLTVSVCSLDGGRIGQISLGDHRILVDRDDMAEVTPTNWGSFPMVPWAGRIRNGRFDFEGTERQLVRNKPPHAIHGTTFDRPWRVVGASGTDVELEIDLGERWPFGGSARQHISIETSDDATGTYAVNCEMTVEAAESAMPVSFGWHPWFRKPDSLEFHPEQQYVRDDEWIATPELVEPGPEPWDDAFINRRPVVMRQGDVEIELRSDLTDWVVFTMPEHSTCVEPQTGPPDALNLSPRVIDRGGSTSASMSILVRPSTITRR